MRDSSIDIAKAIAIILMILGHCPGIPYLLRNAIFSFHMPLFFIFSGYFYKARSGKETLVNGFKHLVIPYLITSLLIILLCISAQEFGLAKDKFIGFIMSNGGWPNELYGANLPYIGPIWFLLALFWCKYFYALLKQIISKSLFASFIISTLAFIIGKYIINLPFGILTGFCGLVFYAMGDYWRNRIKGPIDNIHLIVGIIIWAFCVWKSHLELATFDCKHYPFNMVAAFIGTYCTYLIAQKTPAFIRPLMCWIGKNTLLILCYHTLSSYILLNISNYILSPLGYVIPVPVRWVINFAFGLGLPAIHYWFARSIKSSEQN